MAYQDFSISKTDPFNERIRLSLNGEKAPRNEKFDTITAAKLDKIVARAAMSRGEKESAIISDADGQCWLAANPQYLHTKANDRVLDHLITSWGITHPTYPDYQRAFEAAYASLDLDHAEVARITDNPISEFNGTYSKRTFDNVNDFITNERHAALHQVPQLSEDEEAFEDLPLDQLKELLKGRERSHQLAAQLEETKKNADGWLTLHPEFRDSKRNAGLMEMRLRANGVAPGTESIEDFEHASNQLLTSELLTTNPKQVAKKYGEEVKARALVATAVLGSVFDDSSEVDMENMSMEDLRKAANLVMGR
jgi:hypothetical protein